MNRRVPVSTLTRTSSSRSAERALVHELRSVQKHWVDLVTEGRKVVEVAENRGSADPRRERAAG
jgi:hypothetical protein